MNPRLAVGVAVTVVFAAGCAGRAPDPGTALGCVAGQVVGDVAYHPDGGHDGLTTIDVFPLDECGPVPILVWVHGGAWQGGDKGNQVSGKRQLAAEHGWMLVSVNYRLVPAVRYPVPNEDAARAVAWVVDHAAEYGADPARVAVMGHSAGGGIVAAITTDERYLAAVGHQLSDVDCSVALDTEGYDVAAQAERDIYQQMFGTDPSHWPDQSPVNHIAAQKGIPDYLMVIRGEPARLGAAQRFADALHAARVPVTVVRAFGLSHAEVNDAVGDPRDRTVTPPLVDFLDACFA